MAAGALPDTHAQLTDGRAETAEDRVQDTRTRARTFKLAPSILTADLGYLADAIGQAEAAGVDYIHLDVMDGRFVPNISIGPLVVAAVRKVTNLPLDVHLMIVEPDRYVEAFAQAGATGITVHQEACLHLQRQIHQIKQLGVRAGVALNPATPLVAVEEIVADLDLLLIMSVNPGFGGQSFIPASLDKVRRAHALLAARGATAELEVDGGVTAANIASLAAAGATVFVAGSAIYNPRAPVAEAVTALRAALP
jgi:ribulose-phosphate 3-epimerase